MCATHKQSAAQSQRFVSSPSITALELTRTTSESQLKTHDIEVPIENGIDPRIGNAPPARLLRVLLLSRSAVNDAKLKETMERIQHFALLTGGQHLLILFLLNPPEDASFTTAKKLTKNDVNPAGADAILAYSKLQAEMIGQAGITHIPIRPILDIDELQTTIEKHITTSKTQATRAKPASTSFELLKFCTVNPPMSHQAAYIISDIFTDLKDLASACSVISSAPNSSSPSACVSAFQSSQTYDLNHGSGTESTDSGAARKLKHLRDLVGEQECQDVIAFWKEEWLF
jgi:hypothetical protein